MSIGAVLVPRKLDWLSDPLPGGDGEGSAMDGWTRRVRQSSAGRVKGLAVCRLMGICQFGWDGWGRFLEDLVRFFAGGVSRCLLPPPSARNTLLPGGELLQSVCSVALAGN